MANVTLASPCINRNLSHTLFAFEDNPPRSREASFSSYLSATADESFSLRLGGEPTEGNPTPFQISLGRRKKKAQDGELDIFGAERYFSGGMDGEEAVMMMTMPERGWKQSPPVKEGESGGHKTRSGTPSACSEVSGNSRSSLLREARKGPPQDLQKPPPTAAVVAAAGGKRLLGIFRCACSGKDSVEVDKNAGENDVGQNPVSWPGGSKAIRPEFWYNEETGWRRTDAEEGDVALKRENCFPFPPTLNPAAAGNLTVGRKFEEGKRAGVALDVFGSPSVGKVEFGSGLRRSLAALTPFPAAAAAAATRDDDLESESSSDLFEIESISTFTNPSSRQDGATTTWYEPSEASIEWSVVTASAGNFSVASRYSVDDDRSPPPTKKAPWRHHQRPGLLLGCRRDKAVRVVTSNTYKTPEKAAATDRLHRVGLGEAVIPAARHHSESQRAVDFEPTRTGHALAARAPQRSIPAHAQCKNYAR